MRAVLLVYLVAFALTTEVLRECVRRDYIGLPQKHFRVMEPAWSCLMMIRQELLPTSVCSGDYLPDASRISFTARSKRLDFM